VHHTEENQGPEKLNPRAGFSASRTWTLPPARSDRLNQVAFLNIQVKFLSNSIEQAINYLTDLILAKKGKETPVM
jgi:hypothetical protein